MLSVGKRSESTPHGIPSSNEIHDAFCTCLHVHGVVFCGVLRNHGLFSMHVHISVGVCFLAFDNLWNDIGFISISEIRENVVFDHCQHIRIKHVVWRKFWKVRRGRHKNTLVRQYTCANKSGDSNEAYSNPQRWITVTELPNWAAHPSPAKFKMNTTEDKSQRHRKVASTLQQNWQATLPGNLPCTNDKARQVWNRAVLHMDHLSPWNTRSSVESSPRHRWIAAAI